MSLSRDLAKLESYLHQQGLDPFRASDLNDSAAAQDLLAKLEASGISDAAQIARLCLQALRIQRAEFEPQLCSAEFVATIPRSVPGMARPTKLVIAEMIASAKSEIIILGYELTDRLLVDRLAEAVARGVDVTLILDRRKAAAEMILGHWPAETKRPKIYHDKQRPNAGPFASQHAKCLLVDEKDLLVTSANFTFHGLHENIEIGVRLSGSSAAEARKIFSHLVESGLAVECS